MVEEGGTEEEPVAVERLLAPVDDHLGAGIATTTDVGRHPVAVLAGDERPHLRRRVGAGADDELVEAQPHRVDERIADVADGDDHADRHAPLARRAVGGAHRGVGRQVEVGVGQDDHVVLGAAERLHALAVRGAGLVHVASDRRGAHEADRADVGVLEDAVHRDLVAVHDVEHAVGEPGLVEDLGDQHAGAGVALGRLEHDGVPARDAFGTIHSGTMHGKLNGVMHPTTPIGWRSERTSTPPDDLRREVALQQLRHAARELDALEAALHLTGRVGERLAVLGGDHRGQLLLAAHHRLAHREQQVGALAERAARATSAAPRPPPRRRRRPPRPRRGRPRR